MNRFANIIFSTALLALAASAFLYAPAAHAQSRVINYGSGECLGYDFSYNAYTDPCTGLPAQVWTRTLGVYQYQLKNNYVNRCLEATSTGNVVLSACNTSRRSQGWRRVVDASTSTVIYQNQGYAGCLDGRLSGRVLNAACSGTNIFQKWR
jgi:Ricin-type beta-trefoil lectin domain